MIEERTRVASGRPALTIIMPALDEENDVGAAMAGTLSAFDDFGIAGELVAIDDGSRDRTRAIIEEAMARDGRVRCIRNERPRGIGASFWEGVDEAHGDIVCLLPGDNENDPGEIFRYIKLLEHVDIVVPFVFNKSARSLFRNGLSFLYRFIINTTFLVNFNYTNGTILWRRSLLLELDPELRSGGFFFQTDALIRLVKRGYLFAEVPYRLGLRSHGGSKAVTFPSLMNVVRGYLRLVRDVRLSRAGRVRPLCGDSAAWRRGDDSPAGPPETGG